MKVQSMRPEYVEFIPSDLEEGVLYISKRFNTASHLCCCGCRTKIVTPLRDIEYKLVERGNAVSLYPSVGNWNQPCRSHYWIRENRIIWAAPMTEAQINMGRAMDDAAREAYFQRAAWPWWRRAISLLKGWIR